MRVAKRLWAVIDDRMGLSKLLGPVLSHPVPNATGWVGWSYALGSAVLFTFMLQVVTGIALATVYVPSTAAAYDSLLFITHEAALGGFLRGLHNYGATAMIVFVGLHIIQTFLVGAYKYPREANWLTGAALLLLTLALAFTGQLLRWDNTAYWSVFVLAEQAERAPLVGQQLAQLVLAGETVGGATLTRFYALHVFFVPALVFAFVGAHLWLVLHTGVSEPPRSGRPVDPKTYRAWYKKYLEREGVPFWPDAAWRDVALGVGVLAAMALLAIIVGPPALEKPPDPTILEAYPRPDWYFVWIFAALALVPQWAEDLVIIGAPAAFGVLLILLPFFANKGERSPRRRPWAVGIVLAAVLMVGTLYVAGERAPWSPEFDARPIPAALLGTNPPESVARGAVLYNTKGCEACHAYAGYGGARGPNLTAVRDRLTREQLIVRIVNGGEGMPAYGGQLSPSELDALVAFLNAPRPPESPREATRGQPAHSDAPSGRSQTRRAPLLGP
jgi:ubiquinol-cytochrome c reductase cytochrome b subunit